MIIFYQGDEESELTTLCEEISSHLRAQEHRMGGISRQRPSEWQYRLNRREESWDEIRNLLLNAVICNQSLPQYNVSHYAIYNLNTVVI